MYLRREISSSFCLKSLFDGFHDIVTGLDLSETWLSLNELICNHLVVEESVNMKHMMMLHSTHY